MCSPLQQSLIEAQLRHGNLNIDPNLSMQQKMLLATIQTQSLSEFSSADGTRIFQLAEAMSSSTYRREKILCMQAAQLIFQNNHNERDAANAQEALQHLRA